MKRIFTFLALLVFVVNVLGQTPQLVKNINPVTQDPNSHSNPERGNFPNFRDTGAVTDGRLFFPARNYNGTELWQTDGTDAGTTLTKDINNIFGPYQDANPMFMQTIGNDLFFFTAGYDYSTNRFNEFRLRKRIGTTGYVDDGSLPYNPFNDVHNVIEAGGYLYFIGYNADPGSYYYTSDTALIKYDPVNNYMQVINTGRPRELFVFNDHIIFDADNGTDGREPWVCDLDGNDAHLLFDINQNPGASSDPHDFIKYKGSLWYTADDGNSGMQLKSVDSTLSRFSGAYSPNNPHHTTVFNDHLYFRTTDDNSGVYDVYKFNADTYSVDFVANDYKPGNGKMAIANNYLFFAASGGSAGNQLWQTDGSSTTLAGNASVNDYGDANPDNFTVVNDKLLFVADDNSGNRELLSTDGTNNVVAQGTLQTNGTIYPPRILAAYNGNAYFYFNDGVHGEELWKTDGTENSGMLVKDINLGDNSSIGSNIAGMEVFKGEMYFGATTDGNNVSLYKSDGTPGGTAEAVSGSGAGLFYGLYYNNQQIKAVGNTLFFVANDFTHGFELWKTDGTQAGTSLVKDIRTTTSDPYNPGNNDGSAPDNFTAVNGLLYFTADDGVNNRQLWKSDGTAAGTVLIKDINGNNDPEIGNMTADTANHKLYFTANDGSHGNEPWVSDGTPAGTFMLKDIYAGSNTSSAGGFEPFKGKMYFGANNPAYGTEPWVTDGTTAGTTILKDIYPGSASSNGGFSFASLGSYLYFGADSLGQSNLLWRTDGTSTGTHFFTSKSAFNFNLANMGNKITYIAGGPIGFSMYTTDGTDAGTIKLTDFGTHGTGSFLFGNFVSFKNHYFTWISDGEHGMEMWQTDGTPAGTFLSEVAPGELSSYPTAAKGSPGPLLFAANDGSATGYELWKLNVSASVTWLSFTATKTDTAKVFLEWKTINETNNKGFTIQHSLDNIHYDSLGYVPAGSPNGATYNFTDTAAQAGNNYYRLKQTDLSGNVEYSNVEAIFITTPLRGGIIKSSEVLCTGVIPANITDSVTVTGGLGIYTYQWQDSTTAHGWQNITNATGNTYQPPVLNITTGFRRQVKDGVDSALSNMVIKAYPDPVDTTVIPSDKWNVYVSAGTPQPVYYGYYTIPAFDYNSTTDWDIYSDPSRLPRYIGCPLLSSDYFNLVLKRKGFAAGNYVMNLISLDDGIEVYVNGVRLYAQTYTGGSDNPTVSLGTLTPTSEVVIRYHEVNSGAYLNFAFFLSDLKPGSIAGNQAVCASQTPDFLYTTAPAYGGPAPLSISYQWQDSTAGGHWQNIAGANATGFQPPMLTATHYYRRAALDGVSTPAYSDTVFVNIIAVTEIPVITKGQGRVLSINTVPNVIGYKWFRNGTLIGGAADQLTYTALLAGTYTARYTMPCGDGPLSNTIVFAADAQAQSLTFPTPSNIQYSGIAFVKLAATASSGLPVRYTVTGGAAVISHDTAFVSGIGTVTIQADQPGNDTYTAAVPVSQSFTVSKGDATITFYPAANKKTGDTVQLNASSSSALPVAYSIISGPATISGNIVTVTGGGTITIAASQSGNGYYNAAPDATISFCAGIKTLGDISGETVTCPGIYKYRITPVNGALYEWGVSSGGTVLGTNITGDTVTVQWQTAGNYILYVKGYSSCDVVRTAPSTLAVNVSSTVIPEAVTNMLPASGTNNLQLPLVLSWIPGRYTSNYDLYVWPSADPQPSTPLAAGLYAVNYMLPLNSLAYNQTYKWRVISHSGCATTDGPVQTFRLIPLPDLVVSNVQTPATAFSGQQIAISWKVSNTGPGITNTSQHWTDAVYLSFDDHPVFNIPPQTNPGAFSTLDFPVRPLLVGVVNNVSALNVGEAYTNSINFTLPLNYSQPLYAYVITNYAPGSTAPLEITSINDTAHAPAPMQVTLSPAPDLRVDTVVTPATTFSGSTINVTFKVKNYGATTLSGNNWADKVYISSQPFFDPSTATLLNAPKYNGTYYYNAPQAAFGNGRQLEKDSSYTTSASVVIPNFIYGTYYIYVVTDAGGSVYEGPNEGNNSGFSQVQVFITPTPMLTVSALNLPASVSITQPVGLNWNIKNNGLYDNLQKNQGHYLGVSAHCSICYQRDCYYPPPGCIDCNVICPPPQPGYSVFDSLGYGSSHWTDRIYLSSDSTGLDIPNALFLGSYQHGPVNYENNDFLSSLPVGSVGIPDGANPRTYDKNTVTALYYNGLYPGNFGFNIPDNLPQGKYFVYLYANADKAVYEYPAQIQVARSAAILIQRPDVTVPALAVPATATAGQPIVISYYISNSGPGSVFNHYRKDAIYMSTSSVFDGTAQLVASPTYTENILASLTVNHQFSYNLPINISGKRYFYIVTNPDSSFRENSYINNTSVTAANTSVTITPAQSASLTVSSITVPDTVFAIKGFRIRYTVPNNGVGPTVGNWKDSVYISCSPTFSAATAYAVAARQHTDAIPVGGSYTDSFTVNLPFTSDINSCFVDGTTPAYFYVKPNADHGVYEFPLPGADSVMGTSVKTVMNPLVDQIVTSVTGADTAIIGRSYSTGWTVKNLGYNPGTNYYAAWYDAILFSKDSVLDNNAMLGGYVYENTPLNTNQSYTGNTNSSFTVPNLTAGDYYVFVKSNYYNSIPAEHNLANNANLIRDGLGAAKPVHIVVPLLPDLQDTIFSTATTVATGQPLTVRYKVINKGQGVTYPSTWSDDFFLSADYIPGNSGDIYLGARNHSGALQPDSSYVDSLTATITQSVPPGNYVLIARTNAGGRVFESDATNDLSFQYVTVYKPAPSDLTVQNIIHPDTAYLGYADTTIWTITNLGINAANGIETDGIYISKSSTFDSTAILLGAKTNNLALLPLAKDTLTLTPLVQGVTEGSYYVFVRTDILNNIVESDKSNNTALADKQIYIGVRPLPLGVLTVGKLNNSPAYYKLTIPDSLRGATVLITLKSDDSLSVNNQLYTGLGYVPSASHFDFAYGTPNSGNQQILMPSALDSAYYITAFSTTPNSPLQNITLLAQRLPFSIISVDAKEGGNTGNVTVKLTGSLFTNGMKASLHNSSITILADTIYYINSTTAFATFNLKGQALGTYAVTLKKGDTASTTLADGFKVVAPNNGGLITGTGVNTGGAGTGSAPGCDPGATSGLNSQLQAQLVIPPSVLVGWPFVIQINYSNSTNVDIPVQTRILYSIDGLPVSFTKAGLADGKTTLYIEFSEQNGPPGIIRAGSTGSIIVYSIPPPNYPGHKDANYNLR